MPSIVTYLINDESGATAIEYGLLAAFISLAMLLGLTLLSEEQGKSINSTSQKIQSATD